MANNALHKVVEQAKANRRRNRWNQVVTGMAAFVVFCTTYALILPAITEEREPLCGLEEHVHEDKCWELPKVITCPYEGKAENGELPFLVHTHDELCYDTFGNLICALPEVESHVHDYRCYTEIVPEAPHTHSDACCTEEKVLTCTLEEREGHVHGDGCVFGEPRLICEIPEGHVHEDVCTDESGNLICRIPESHTHGTACFEEPVCELSESEGHTHGDACYTIQKVLTCGKTEAAPEEIAAYTGEPEQVLICGKEEVILHQHTAECRDEDGNLVCGLKELYAHQHGRECLTATRDPEAEKVLVCGFKEEHTHDDTCYTDLEADLETPEIWEAGLPEHTDNWSDDLIAVALTQLGYTESTENVTVSPEGLIFGYTRYGQWAGTPYAPWSLTFVDFCQHYAGIPADAFPVHESQLRWCEQLKEENWNLYWTPDQYTTVPGDLVFLDLDVDGKMDAEAIVLELTEDTEETKAKLTVIQGDVEGSVQKAAYDPTDPVILGYVSTAAARSRWDFLNPAPQPEPVRYCGLEAHTHTPECYDAEENLICEIPEHTHEDACLVPPVVYYCGMEAHKHDENCYDNQGTMTCQLSEHTHEALCQVEQKYFCGIEEHLHDEAACYDENNVLICGMEAHSHGETCELSQQTIEAQIEAPATLELDEEAPEEQTVVRVSGLIPNGALVKAVPVDLSDLYEGFVCAYDISIFTAQGREFQPVIPLKVTFDIPGQTLTEEDDVSICYVPKLDEPDGDKIYSGELQKMTSEVNADGNLTFDAPHFTTYAEIVGYAAEPLEGTYENANPPCPGSSCNYDTYLTEWTPCTGTNPFGTAQEYNLFLLGNMHNWEVVHGNAAIMGDITGDNGGIGYDDGSNQNYAGDKTSHFYTGLVLGGLNGANTRVTVKNGSVISQYPLGDIEAGTANDRIDMERGLDSDHNHIAEAEELKAFFDNARGSEEDLPDPTKADKDSLIYRNWATYDYCVNTLPDNGEPGTNNSVPSGHKGSVDYLRKEDMDADQHEGGYKIGAGDCVEDKGGDVSNCDVILVGTNDLYNVFNVPASMLSSKAAGAQRSIFLAVPYGSYTIINVIADGDDTIEDFNPMLRYQDSNDAWIQQPAKQNMANYTQTQRTLINFDPSIEKVTMGQMLGTYVYASILGPNVDLEVPENASTNLHGTIVLENLNDIAGKSAILDNPFSVGSKLHLAKSVVCDDNMEGCPIDEENQKESGDWEGYYADVVLNSVKDTSGTDNTSETIVINLPSLDLNSSSITIDGLTSGRYIVYAERVYRKVTVNGNEEILEIQDGTGLYFKAEPTIQYYNYDENTGELTPVNIAEAKPDQRFTTHRFSHATFGTFDGSVLSDHNKVILDVEMGMEGNVLITNHYGMTNSTQHIVQKTWWEHKQVIVDNVPLTFVQEITPPKGAYVNLTLMRKKNTDSEEQWVKVPDNAAGFDQDGNPLKPTVKVTAEMNWTYAWTKLPDRVDNSSNFWEYKAEETYCYEGFVESENGSHDINGIQTFYNYRKKAEPGTLEVSKIWYDETGTALPGDSDKHPTSVDVKLYCKTGTIDEKEPGNTYPTITVTMDGHPITLEDNQVFSGSDAKLAIDLWYTSGLAYGTNTGKVEFIVKRDGKGIPYENPITHSGTSYPPFYAIRSLLQINVEDIKNDTVIDITTKQQEGKDFAVIYNVVENLYNVTNPIPHLKEYPDGHMTWTQFQEVTNSYPNLQNPITKLGDTLSETNKWTTVWTDLPKVDQDGNQLQYFVFEDINDLSNSAANEKFYDYEQSYKVAGKDYPKATPGASNGVPGMTEGYITIENRPIIGGPELPMTGGPGTLLYTLGGLLTAAFAGILLQYNHRKRGKEGNAF